MNHPIGQLASLVSALAWAGALVFFKRSGERVAPIALNLFKNAVAIALLAATLIVLTVLGTRCGPLGGEYEPDFLWRLSFREYALLAASGIIGIAVADTVFFYGLNLIGVGLVSIVDCCYSPSVLLFTWLLLGEQPALPHYVGGGLILVGILVASGHKPPAGRTRGQILLGMLLTIVAIVAMALGIVLAKPVLTQVPVIWATSIRLVAGTAALTLLVLWLPGKSQNWAIFKPARVWWHAIPAAFLGTYLSLIAWLAGFKYTYAAVAAVLNQTSVIFSLILASLFLKEHFGARKMLAAELAVVGIVIIAFPGLFPQLARQPLLMATIAAALISGPVCYWYFASAREEEERRGLPAGSLEQEKVR